MKNKTLILNLFFLPISLLFLFLLFKNYQQYLDISMVDETGYMELLNFNPLIYPGGYGPLYILSYKIIYQIIHNFIQLHYFAIIALTWLPSLILFYFLRSRNVSYFISVYASWAMLISVYIAAFDWWARTAHFSILFIFLMFILIATSQQKSQIKNLLFAFFTARILAYVRPELALTSYLILFVLIIIFVYQKFIKKNAISFSFNKIEKIIVATLFLVYIAMFLIWKSPTQNTGRMYFALGQHYKFNTMRWNNEERKEFLHWEETFKKQFGESKNLSDMYKANPTETIKHIRENILHYFQQTASFVTEIFMPNAVFKFHYGIKWLIFSMVFLLLVFKIGFRNYIHQLKIILSEHYLNVIISACFAIPSLMASFAIYPREHYFIMQLVFIYYFFYILLMPLKSSIDFASFQNPISLLVLIFVLVILTPNVKSYTRYNNFNTYERPNYLPYINTIKQLKIDSTVTFLSFEILPIYIGKNFKGYPFFIKKPFYDSIIVAQDIDMMYISETIEQDKRHQSDATFHYFMNNYRTLGWQKLQLKNKNGYILYKKYLLNENK